MDPALMNKLQEMEEEMNRFEREIAVPQPSYSTTTNAGPSLKFLPHSVQRANQTAFHRNIEHSESNVSTLPGIHPDISSSVSIGSGLYVPQPSEYTQAVISAPPQPSVIKAAPTLYTSQQTKIQSKIEESVVVIPKPPEKKIPEPAVVPTYIPPYIRQLGVGASVSAMNDDSSNKPKYRKKRIIRSAGGQHWEDNTLLEWDPDDFRIFCGDLGNDVTDEVLTRAFGKFPSFVKARVIRDKRNNKTKGYGFVSFKDPQDFIRAMKEMNGKYVGSRPIKLRKSTWKDRNIESVRKKNKEKQKLGLR